MLNTDAASSLPPVSTALCSVASAVTCHSLVITAEWCVSGDVKYMAAAVVHRIESQHRPEDTPSSISAGTAVSMYSFFVLVHSANIFFFKHGKPL